MHPATQVFVGIGVTDFLVAFLHFFEDTYMPYTKDPSVIGAISRANELHHYVPYSITTSSFLELVSVTSVISALVAAALYLVAPDWASRHGVMIGTMCLLGSVSNVIHKYQHERPCRRPAWITALMDAGIVVSRDEHRQHHVDPSTKYGVITSVGNSVYDGLGVWRFFEKIIPLNMYPKSANDTYDKIVPEEIKSLVKEECPRHLTVPEVDALYALLEKHQN